MFPVEGGGQGLGQEEEEKKGQEGYQKVAQEKLSSKLALIHRGHEYAWGPLEEGYWFPLL